MGSCSSTKEPEYDEIFLSKLNQRRNSFSKRLSNLDSEFYRHSKMKLNLLLELKNSFPPELQETEAYISIRKTISNSSTKEVLSTFSYIQWERDFIDMIRNEEHPLFLMEIQSNRFSSQMLNKIKKNLFWKILKIFDYVIAKKYQIDINEIFDEVCDKGKYKKMKFETMVSAMINLKDSELRELKNPDLLNKAKKIQNEILKLIKHLGIFLSRVMYYIYSDDSELNIKRTEDFFSMCIILNSLLKSKYIFYCYCIFLTKILIIKKKKVYLKNRQKSKSNLRSFDDLIYMKKFLVDEDSQKIVRSHSVQYLRDSSNSKNIDRIEKMTPKGLHGFLKSSMFLEGEELKKVKDRSTNVTVNHHIQMDIHEFLVHLNLHLKMNLDFVFSSDLKEMLTFFSAIEDFMEKTFGNTELEVKIDLMRLIIRMTNATLFIEKIYLLDKMRIQYLEYWQTFSLFTQVLLAELFSVGSEVG